MNIFRIHLFFERFQEFLSWLFLEYHFRVFFLKKKESESFFYVVGTYIELSFVRSSSVDDERRHRSHSINGRHYSLAARDIALFFISSLSSTFWDVLLYDINTATYTIVCACRKVTISLIFVSRMISYFKSLKGTMMRLTIRTRSIFSIRLKLLSEETTYIISFLYIEQPYLDHSYDFFS